MLIAPSYSNCLIWAIYHWRKRGGYVTWRWSHQIKYLPHFLWAQHLTGPWYSYVPINQYIPWWHLIFRGHAIENYKMNSNIQDEIS